MLQIISSLLLLAGLRVGADRLDQVYSPPTGAATAGGYPGDISAPNAPPVIPIIAYNFQPNSGDGSYSYSYETGNGIKASEEGSLKELGPETQAQVVSGAYSYTGEDGVVYTIVYTADENGFVAKGDHLPRSPPIPPEIQAALEQNAAEEAAPQQGTPAPAQVGYFKNYPSNNYNRNYNQQQNYYQQKYNYNQNYNKYYRKYK